MPFVLFLIAFVTVRPAAACDIRAVYTATELRETSTGFRLGVAAQYSDFGTELLDGHEVTLPAKEHMDSSVTQFLVGYSFHPRFGLQLNIPYIYRSFTRIHRHEIEDGVENGLGDLALVANLLAYRAVVGQSLFRFSLLGGVKFPTGDSSFLAEEFVAAPLTGPQSAARVASKAAGEPASILPLEGGLHGHDLALGSGSFDGIAGGQLFWTWRRAFASATMQYAIRSTGDFEYRFADDLTWTGVLGWFALLEHGHSLGVEASFSGETKGNDSQQGRKTNDTAMTALYVGPGLSATWRTSLGCEFAVDLPVIQHNTSLQLVPDLRLRGGLTWRF